MVETISRWLVVAGCCLVLGACGLTGESQPAPGNQDTDQQNDSSNDTTNDANGDENGTNGDENGNSSNANSSNEGDSDAAQRVLDLVTSQSYGEMIIEVDYVPGRTTRDGVADRIATGLDEVVDKPDGIEISFDEEIQETAPDGGWTFEQLEELSADYIDEQTGGNTAMVHTMLVDGEYADSEGTVLGIAWANRYLVLFMDELEDACQNAAIPAVNADTLCEHAEVTVWRHELGHVLGLVDNGAPKQTEHEDSEHAHHCDNDECVMFWSYRRPDMFERLLSPVGGNPETPDFDQACGDDLEAVK